MGKNSKSVSNDPKTHADDEAECLQEMNKFLTKLKIEQKWEKYDEIRMIGQPNRNIFYTIIGILFPIMYIFGTQYRMFPQQNVVLQITGVILAFAIKQNLPKHSFTIQFANKEKVEIDVYDKERFEISKKMYAYMRDMERLVRVQRIDKIKFAKKTN